MAVSILIESFIQGINKSFRPFISVITSYIQTMAESEYFLPLGEVSQNLAAELPEMVPENWTSLKKSLESYIRVMLFDMRDSLLGTEDKYLDFLWEASKYNIVGDPPDRTKILLKSPRKAPLSEVKIQQVANSIRECLGVGPPDEWLELLRITNGVWAAGTYEPDDHSCYQMAPFSTWEAVEYAIDNTYLAGKEDNNMQTEIQEIYKWTSPKPNFTLKCGFKCGMIGHEYGPDVAVYYFYGEYSPASPGEVRGSWELVANIVPKWGCYDRFENIPALLKFWAENFIRWHDLAK
jgi:hypothetical protein